MAGTLAELMEILETPDPTPGVLLDGFDRFPDDVKNAAVDLVARRIDPPPASQTLGLLHHIITDANRPVAESIFLVNLRLPDDMARAACLRGLAELGHPAIKELALVCLRDRSDHVAVAAAEILAPIAADDPQLRQILTALRKAHDGDNNYFMTNSFLDSAGFGS